jgi:hypothetical protein
MDEFQESNLFQELFAEIVARGVAAGLVKGEHMSVDGSFMQAHADAFPANSWRNLLTESISGSEPSRDPTWAVMITFVTRLITQAYRNAA